MDQVKTKDRMEIIWKSFFGFLEIADLNKRQIDILKDIILMSELAGHAKGLEEAQQIMLGKKV